MKHEPFVNDIFLRGRLALSIKMKFYRLLITAAAVNAYYHQPGRGLFLGERDSTSFATTSDLRRTSVNVRTLH